MHGNWHQCDLQILAVVLLLAPQTPSCLLCSHLWVSITQSPFRLLVSTSPETTWPCDTLLMCGQKGALRLSVFERPQTFQSYRGGILCMGLPNRYRKRLGGFPNVPGRSRQSGTGDPQNVQCDSWCKTHKDRRNIQKRKTNWDSKKWKFHKVVGNIGSIRTAQGQNTYKKVHSSVNHNSQKVEITLISTC